MLMGLNLAGITADKIISVSRQRWFPRARYHLQTTNEGRRKMKKDFLGQGTFFWQLHWMGSNDQPV